jgi:hypothetical protein
MTKRNVKSQPEAELVTLAAVSRRLGVAPATIANSPEDFFPHHRLGGRRYVFGRDFKAWLARRATASTTATA